MIEVRNVSLDELDAVSAVPVDDGGRFAEQVRSMLAEGTTKPEWLFVAVADGQRVARAAYYVDEPPSNAPMEMYLFGLSLDWARAGARDAALELLQRSLPSVAAVGPPVDARVNRETHPDFEARRSLLEEAGFGLFQEKESYVWRAGGPMPARSTRLTFKSLPEVGRDQFIHVMALGPAGTLDRNDRYYYELTGPVGWATVMMGFLGEGDDESWKVAFDPDGRPVGYVMLSAFDEERTATIAHIGVVPQMRGRGYIDDLLAEATHDAVARGRTSILSDADVLNVPMGAAFERAGHQAGVRPWHVWHYRFPQPQHATTRSSGA